MSSHISASLMSREADLMPSLFSAQLNQSFLAPSTVQLVVIDSAVDAPEQLLRGVSEYAHAIILNPQRDGIEQITEALAQLENVRSIHIIAHGSAGQMRLGDRPFNLESLTRYSQQLRQWADYLSDQGGLLLYGCNLAAGEAGAEFLAALQQLTGLAIAASTSKVGHPDQGGSWHLNVALGNVDPRSPFLPVVLKHYQGVFPDLGTALEFDGVDDYIEVPDSPELKLTSNLTLEAWIKIPPVTGGDQRIVGKEIDYVLSINSGANAGKVEFLGSDYGRVITSDATIDDDQWHHVAITYDSSTLKLYIDGVLDKEVAATGTLNTSTSPLRISDAQPVTEPGGYINGSVDEIRIWNVTRSAAEIQAAKDGQLTGTETGLVAYYNFNEGSGTTLIDRTANGNDGTLQNMTEASWVASFDDAAPTADIVDVAPDPRGDAVNAITIQFSEVVDNVDLSDLSLTLDGATVDLTGATLNSTDNITWVLGNLGGLTNTDGSYELTLATSDITDGAANALAEEATDSWVKQVGAQTDTIPPTADIIDVSPDPRESAVDEITLQFNEVVENVDLADLSLTRDGVAVALTEATLESADGVTWVLGNLDGITGDEGVYELSLATSDITDLAGNALAEGATDRWRVGDAFSAADPLPNPKLNEGTKGEKLRGSQDQDKLRGTGDNDRLLGRDGDDNLIGKAGNDLAKGGKGDDRARGASGDDRLLGNDGDDNLIGGDGDDLLIGGKGSDRMRGNGGADTFRYTNLQDFGDTILDYAAEDVIDLRRIFGRAEFAAASKTEQLKQFIELAQVGSNAELRIDADGSGVGTERSLIATLQGLDLTTTTVNIVV